MPVSAGLVCSDAVINAWKACVNDKKRKFLLLKIVGGQIEICNPEDPEDAANQEEGTSTFDHFISQFPENECRYGLYQLDFEVEGGYGRAPRSKNILLSWAPTGSPMRQKMVHAATLQTLQESLGEGKQKVDKVINADCESELQSDNWISEISSMGTMKAAGKMVAFEGEEL